MTHQTETDVLARNLHEGVRFGWEGGIYTVFHLSPDRRVFDGRVIGITTSGRMFDFAPDQPLVVPSGQETSGGES